MAAAAQPQPQGFLARRFHTAERGTSPRTELLGGVATLLTMSYRGIVPFFVLFFAADWLEVNVF